MTANKKKAKAGKKKRVGTMDIILIVVAVALLAFTIEMIRLFEETGMIPDTLCTCVFAALGGECGIMGWIKTTKERNKEREWQQEDQAHTESREDAIRDKEEQYVINRQDQ